MKNRLFALEWKLLAADRATWIVLGVFALAVAYALFSGTRWVDLQQRAIEDAMQEEQQRYAGAEARIAELTAQAAPVANFSDPRNPDASGSSLAGRYAVLPPGPLAATAVGQSDLLPSYIPVTTEPLGTLLSSGELENPHRLLMGRFDLAFVLIYLFPLLIIAVGYNVLSGEREQGTLALALSQPVAVRTLLFGKVGIRGLMLLAVLVVFAVLGLASGAMQVRDMASLVSLLLWLAAAAAYGAFWFALVIAVQAWGKGSATNAMTLAGVWLVLVIVMPATVNALAKTLYPMPSRVEMIQALRVASDEAQARGSGLLAGYFEDHPELAPNAGDLENTIGEFMLTRLAVREEVERQVAPVMQRFDEQLAAQQAVVDRLRFVSPAIVLQGVLYDLAGTGAERHRHFAAQVASFHAEWREFFAAHIRNGTMLEHYGDNPVFAYQEEPRAAVVGRVGVSLFALLLLALLIGALGTRRLAGYPVSS